MYRLYKYIYLFNGRFNISIIQHTNIHLILIYRQMNSMPHRTRVTSNRSSPYTGNVKVLLDLDNQHLASVGCKI